jgi:cytochrome c oxidase subunit 2
VDAIYFFLIAVSIVFVGLISTALVVLSLRYRKRPGRTAQQIHGSVALEIVWSVIPLVIALTSFAWAARVYFDVMTPPSEGMRFLVTGKQWMWKIQHPTGQREINTLHVPVGVPVILEMTSEDVIHDFYVPAFRVKQDVVPGRYSTVWFEATRVGTYHLFCAEYCGTKHSEMKGQVIVMSPSDYEQWLSGQPAGLRPVEAGRVLFENLRCDTCHAAGSGQRGPDLRGRFGEFVRLSDGQTLLFDEAYARESILEPAKRVVSGYQALMPTYQGQVSEGQIQHLIAYIKALRTDEAERAPR